jgi:aryl-alcohol dehydrogenase-like predicted oxidoreductase
MLTRIGLGTAQFGSAYGISNQCGRPTSRDIDELLELAWLAGVGVLDTAAAYGDAEREIGAAMGCIDAFRIVTKTFPIADPVITRRHGRDLVERFMRSLDHLRQSAVHGLLIHHAELLLRPGGEHLADALQLLRDQHLVSKIGVSVYGADEIDATFDRFPFDIVQLPFSVADQRLLASGHLRRLKVRGVEIHARSVFLQGLLLMSPGQLPAPLSPIAPALDRFGQACQGAGCSPLAACLQFALAAPEIDCVVVGANRPDELADILAACRSNDRDAIDFAALAFQDAQFLNPAQWARLH